ncbi:DUF1080 domain-containing protein [Pontiella sp.]|uniref:3-keto-disaccharide hydrolase n=1 Tax=Pontiella sp. TaxID=2837462 RepID=UPI003569284A
MKNRLFTPLAFAALLSLAHAGTVSDSQLNYVANYRDRQQQPNLPAPEAQLLNTDAEPGLTDGFSSLFNGHDLTGWVRKGGAHRFEIQDGVLVGTCVPGSPNAFLCTEQEFTDFIFTCEMKWEVDSNSGIMFRARSKTDDKGKVTVYGPQCEMEGIENKRGWSGGIYGEKAGGWFYPLWLEAHEEVRQALKADHWNRITIQAEGDTVKTWVNGIPAAHWNNAEYRKGFFGLQVHAGKQGKVCWRNIKLKELK